MILERVVLSFLKSKRCCKIRFVYLIFNIHKHKTIRLAQHNVSPFIFSQQTIKKCLATISTGLQYYAAARNLVVNALLARLFFSFARNQSEKDWTYLLYYAEKKHCWMCSYALPTIRLHTVAKSWNKIWFFKSTSKLFRL